MKLGQDIRDFRTTWERITGNPMTQEDAALGIGVTRNTVARWERGEVTPSGLAATAITRWLADRNRQLDRIISRMKV